MENFPSNSQQPPRITPDEPEEKKIVRLVEGGVKRRKKPLSTRFREMFLGDDPRRVVHYVIGDVLVPAMRDMVADAFSQGFERMIFGDKQPSRRVSTRTRSFSNPTHTDYRRYSSSTGRREDSTRPPFGRSPSRASYNFGEIILENKRDAEQVIEDLNKTVEKYGFATVRDLLEMVGETPSHGGVDEKWGWSDLRGAGVVRIINGGYLLDLPPAGAIDEL